jgi:chromosome segregation ATPase
MKSRLASAIKARAGGAPSPETQELIQKLQRQVSSLAEEKEQYEMQLEGMKSVVRDQQREMQELKEAAPDGGAAFTEANELRIKMENVEQAHAVDMAELTKRLEASELVAAESRAAASVASTASAAKSGADSQALQQQLSDASDQLAVLKASSKGAADEAAAHIAKLETERVRERSNKSVADQLLVEKSAALEAAIVGCAKHEETIAALRKEKADLLVEKHATGEAQAELQTAAGEEKAALQAALDARAAELTELRASGAESAAQLSASEERNAAAAAAADAAAAAAAVAAAEASAQRDEIAALHARVESLEDDIEDCAVKVKIQAKQRNKLIKELKADLGKQHKRLTSTEAQLQEAADMKVKWEALELELAKAKMHADRTSDELEEARRELRSQAAAQGERAAAPRIPAASAFVEGVQRKLASAQSPSRGGGESAPSSAASAPPPPPDDGVKAALAQRLRQLLGENENLRERLAMLENIVQSLTGELATKKKELAEKAKLLKMWSSTSAPAKPQPQRRTPKMLEKPKPKPKPKPAARPTPSRPPAESIDDDIL